MKTYQYFILGGIIAIDKINDFISEMKIYATDNNMFIQLFNADMIYGIPHLESAIMHAIRSEEDKTMSTNSIEMEILLYASGERQLKHAIPKMGIKEGKNRIALVLISKNQSKIFDEKWLHEFCKKFNLQQDNSILDGSLETLKNFGLNPNDFQQYDQNQYIDIILEKVAMVDIIK